MNPKPRVAIIGTAGLPPRYGGFETLADFLTKNLRDQVDFTVYCPSQSRGEGLETYNGARLVYLPLKANGAQSILYDMISIILSLFRYDKLLILGSGGTIVLPLLFPFRKKFILNFGGLEWKRGKWGRLTRAYLKLSERLGVHYSHKVIADNQYFVDYVKEEYAVSAQLIEYGGDHCVPPNDIPADELKRFPFLGSRYFLSVSRAQEDNNIHMLLEGFYNHPECKLVVVSNWDTSEYGRGLKRKYAGVENLVLVDAIYDLSLLNLIRSRCFAYIHSHSFCGTAPSLVEIMNLGKPVLAYAAPTNLETTEKQAHYFESSDDVIDLIGKLDSLDYACNGTRMGEIATRRYTWKIIADKYLSQLT
jgi:glycosyltransferase involved in cell wall biosynthesis